MRPPGCRARPLLIALTAVGLTPAAPVAWPSEGPPAAPLEERIDRAIAVGVEHLRKGQAEDGSFRMEYDPARVAGAANGDLDRAWLSTTALAVTTLRTCGVRSDDPAVRRAVERAWAWWSSPTDRRRRLRMDSAAMTLRAIRSLRDDSARFPTYGTDAAPLGEREFLGWAEALRDWILDHARRGDGGRAMMSPAGADHSHTSTYAAVLGLCAARDLGLEVPPLAWRETMKHMLKAQQRDGPRVARVHSDWRSPGDGDSGRAATADRPIEDRARGWARGDDPVDSEDESGDTVTGQTTAAGVFVVAACRDALARAADYAPEEDRAAERAIRDGVAWLGSRFRADANPGARELRRALVDGKPASPEQVDDLHRQLELSLGGRINRSPGYYDYARALALAGIATGARCVGEHDWYRECAAFLVDAQRYDGSWDGLDTWTCSALMFLRKEGFRMPRAAVTGSPHRGLDVARADRLDDASFAAAFEESFRVAWRADADGSETEACADLVVLGPRVIPLLLRTLEDLSSSRRAAASRVLRRLVADGPPQPVAGDDAELATALAAWEAWWVQRRGRLARDLESHRFISN